MGLGVVARVQQIERRAVDVLQFLGLHLAIGGDRFEGDRSEIPRDVR
jgi:hypothetical protein